MITKDGYVKVRVGCGHPLADPNGYAYEHLVVWVSAGRPRPPRGFLLHHKNEVKDDNRLDNLELKTRPAHGVGHQRGALPDETVRTIREQYATRAADMPTLAGRYGIPVQRVSRFIRGLSRRSAGGPISTSNRGRAGRLLDGVEHNGFPQHGEGR